MVDGCALRCEGMTDELTLTIGSSKVSKSFCVVRGLEYGILGTDILAHLNVQIDVAVKVSICKVKRSPHSKLSGWLLVRFV